MLFREAPADFKKEIDVVGCYIQHAGKFVLLHRRAHKSNGDKLGLPAGKVDSGETIHQAMSREIKEETGLDVSEKNLEHIGSVFVRNEGHDFGYHMFVTNLSTKPEILINPKEHQAYLWTSPSEALEMDLIHDLDECIRTYYRESFINL
ncbi:MAG: NUDIX hydrolase [Candidatus Colwellbacteria bacterium]|nr:NUDIX hydrolase [Candidatus Colwellbacteria bacterium]